MEDKINFFYTIKPFYIHHKFLGLIPFSIDLTNTENVTRKSKCNILYSSFVIVFSCSLSAVRLSLENGMQENTVYKINEFLTRVLIITAAFVTWILNMIRGQEVFNRMIKKIIPVDKQIWHHDLPAIYRASRSSLIKMMLIYIPFESSLVIVDTIWNKKIDIMFIFDIVNTSIVIQIVLLSWLLLKRFNQINKLLDEYFPKIYDKMFLQKQLCSEVETTKLRYIYNNIILIFISSFRGFGGAMVSMLNFCAHDRGFKPGRSLRIFYER